MENKKQKRYYKVNEIIWSIDLKKEVKVVSVNKNDLTITVIEDSKGEKIEHTFPLWSVDTLKYKKKRELDSKNKKTYFASVNGGVIPTKDEENGGFDCYARLEPTEVEGKIIHELYLPKMQLTKIPLGFASYLSRDNVLSLKHERSSVGQLGLMNMGSLIDSTYQGEVILMAIPLLHNVLITDQVEEVLYDEERDIIFYPAKKAITQAVIFQLSNAKVQHVDYEELLKKPSERKTGGWGSSAK